MRQISLFLSAKNIPKRDKFSESDPYVVVLLRSLEFKDNKTTEIWKELVRTSVQQNQKDPKWPDQITVVYKFEEYQPIRFEIYDSDTKSKKNKPDIFIGSFETCVGNIVTSGRGRVRETLLNKDGKSMEKTLFTVIGEPLKNSLEVLSFKFSASNIQKKNFMGLGKSDPFYKILLKMKNGLPPAVVFQSEYIMKSTAPKWRSQQVPLDRICNGDIKRNLVIEVYDREKNGKHKIIGKFDCTTEDLMKKASFELMNPSAKKKESTGVFHVDEIKMEELPSFLQYVENGCHIKLSIAIDFSKKNGKLHALKTDILNQYQQAIISVGEILQHYDSDKKIGILGFGGSVAGSKLDSDCFPLSFEESKVEVEGVKGIMEVYQSSVGKIAPGEKCNMATVIKNVTKGIVPVTQEEQSYNILLILTSGKPDDLQEVISAIVDASEAPLSIVLVGLGSSAFEEMQHLDSDALHLTTEDERAASRDIVQFVPFVRTVQRGVQYLAQETLEELPQQLERFMWANNISPKLEKKK